MNLINPILALAVTLLARSSACAGEPRPLATNAPARIELQDQYEATQKLSFPAAKPILLTIADKKGSEQVATWMLALGPRYAERITICGMADLGGAPGFVHGRIRKAFRESQKYPVMLDWSGKVCAQIGYQAGVANLLLIGRDGVIHARFTGVATPAAIDAANATLENALVLPPKLVPSPNFP